MLSFTIFFLVLLLLLLLLADAVDSSNQLNVHTHTHIVSTCRSWDQCDLDHDFLSIKDGPSVDSPELARLCGGDVLPDIISSGPNMLIEFKTASTDSLFHPSPISYLLGFELQVQVSLFFFSFYFNMDIHSGSIQ